MVQPGGSARLALALLAAGCTRATEARTIGALPQRELAPSRPELAALASMPSGAQRCSAVLPSRLAPEQRPLAALVSLADPLPWSLTSEVEAYARGEQEDASGRRSVAELVRFRAAARSAIEADLARAFGQEVEWRARDDETGASCEGELTCLPILGRFIDPRTVLLERGRWSDGEGSIEPCTALLARDPAIFEVSARSAAGSGNELVGAEMAIRREREGFARYGYRRYLDPGSAERVLQGALSGHDELPVFAGVTSTSFGERRGSLIEQRAFVSFDELAISLHDRARLDDAQQAARQTPVEHVDAHDAEAVKATFDLQRTRVFAAGPQSEEVRALDALLAHARALAPADEGLLRRHYELQLALLRNPRAALATAEEGTRLADGDALSWQLRMRAALAHVDEARLRGELARAHKLPRESAARMARELVQRAARGWDHERGEWAFLSARQLAAGVARAPRAPLTLRLPLAELGRVFAYVARSVEGRSDVGVQVLVLGGSEQSADAARAEGPWRAETSGAGRAGTIVAATTWDDAQLLALGKALLESTPSGPVELLIGVEQLGGSARTAVALSGQRVGDELTIEGASRTLAHFHWPKLKRLLIEPLSRLVGATYPPDVLTVTATDRDEALEVTRAALGEPRVRCTSEGLVVTCGGALADQGAAARALLAVARALLEEDGRALWSAAD